MVIRVGHLLSLSMPPAKALPDIFCLHQDHKAESSKSPSVLGPYLENNYSKLYSKTSSLLGRRDCKPVHPPTDTYVKSYCLRGEFEIISEDV